MIPFEPSAYNYEPITETATGSYYYLRPRASQRLPSQRTRESFITKLYFADQRTVFEMADTWAHINRYVPDTVTVVTTYCREGKAGLVFRHRQKRLCDEMDEHGGNLDVGMQLQKGLSIARVVLELHKSAEYVHTRLHPRCFYLDSDGRFQLGHFSKAVPANSLDQTGKERERLGLLLVYLLTNTPFDRLLLGGYLEAMKSLYRVQLPPEKGLFKHYITALLKSSKGGSQADIEALLSLSSQLVSPTVPAHSGCYSCALSRKRPIPKGLVLRCGHAFCLECLLQQSQTRVSVEDPLVCRACQSEQSIDDVSSAVSDITIRRQFYQLSFTR